MGNIHPELENFLTAVNYSYQQFDGDYFLLEHTTKSSLERVLIPLKDCTKDRLTREQRLYGYLQEDCMAAAYQFKSNWAKEANSTSLCLRVNLKFLKF
jgi:hypothetical protein